MSVLEQMLTQIKIMDCMSCEMIAGHRVYDYFSRPAPPETTLKGENNFHFRDLRYIDG